jgi:hypothetical protein
MGYKKRYDDVLTSNLKYTLDFIENTPYIEMLDVVFKRYFDEQKVFDDIYLNMDNIQEMREAGMLFGIHGYNHIRLGDVYFKDMCIDLKLGVNVFKKFFDKYPKYISYPHGSYNVFVKRVARFYGLKYGFTIEKRKNDNDTDLLALGRFDANDYKILD